MGRRGWPVTPWRRCQAGTPNLISTGQPVQSYVRGGTLTTMATAAPLTTTTASRLAKKFLRACIDRTRNHTIFHRHGSHYRGAETYIRTYTHTYMHTYIHTDTQTDIDVNMNFNSSTPGAGHTNGVVLGVLRSTKMRITSFWITAWRALGSTSM